MAVRAEIVAATPPALSTDAPTGRAARLTAASDTLPRSVNLEVRMLTTLKVQVETLTTPEVSTFELDSTDLVFIPVKGDKVKLPGMKRSVVVTGRSFEYANPSTLDVWLDCDEESA